MFCTYKKEWDVLCTRPTLFVCFSHDIERSVLIFFRLFLKAKKFFEKTLIRNGSRLFLLQRSSSISVLSNNAGMYICEFGGIWMLILFLLGQKELRKKKR